jgi:hypothetical protein
MTTDEVKISAASGGMDGDAAHFSPGLVPVHFMKPASRRSLRLASQKMASRWSARQFVHTASS